MKSFSYFDRPSSDGIVCNGIGAQQHFKNECDLNLIIKKYPDGVLPPPRSMPVYGDFTAIGKGLQDSMNALQFVSDWFASLPSEIRAKFENDPLKAQRFVIDDPDAAVKLGILSAKEQQQPVQQPAQQPAQQPVQQSEQQPVQQQPTSQKSE